MKKIIGIGNALVDVLTKIPDDLFLESIGFPKGSMQLVDAVSSENIQSLLKGLDSEMTSGGSAANTIHGLARLGLHTSFIGSVGTDDLGDFFKQDLLRSGIHPQLISSDLPTGKAVAMISPDSERTFATYLGAAIDLDSEKLDKNQLIGFDYLYIEGYLVQNQKLISTIAALAKELGLLTVIDLASYNVVAENRDFLRYLIRDFIDVVFANEEEAAAITGEKPETALKWLAESSEMAVVKLGSKGSIISNGNQSWKIDIDPVAAVDTTGAGDLYAAGFLYGLAQNNSPEECGRIGSMLSAEVIQNIGPKIHDKAWHQILKKIKA